MPSTVVALTSVTSFIGFIINVSVMFFILLRGRKKVHLLFAPLLFITACWDLGIFLVMIRNAFANEVLFYQNIVTIPVLFFPAFVYHFTTTYLNKPRKISTIAIYGYCVFGLILVVVMGGGGSASVYNYDWGTVARLDPNPVTLSWLAVYFLCLIFSCWFLFQARRRETSPIVRRHMGYILASFIVFCAAQIKLLVIVGVDAGFTVPLGMSLVDLFGALIGVAIVKDRLFDITVILKKGTIYSILAALIIFLFSLSEHLIATYLASIAGGLYEYLHFISLAVVVGAFIPLKKRLDHTVGGYFARKKIAVEF